ncbi:MAG: LysR family transcriptional regulator [Burkholderiales bacterium]|nr:LysR family transcriptional regulator [Burkholderiales bacterium]
MIRSPSPLSLSMRQLRAFATIARTGSFTRAAEELHMSQPGLSGMVRDMEQQLDCRMFERTTRSVTLTPHGQVFLPVAARVLADLDTAAVSLGELNSAESHRLVIGATPFIASSVLPEVCQIFARSHPGVQVTVRDLDRANIHAGVRAGELDAGFGVFMDASRELRRTLLLHTSLILASSADGQRTAAGWNELKGIALLSLPPNNPIQKLVDARLREVGVEQSLPQVFLQLHTALSIVELGPSCAVLPSFVSAVAHRYRVNLRPLTHPRVRMGFYEITRSGAPRTQLLMDFGDCLVQTMHDKEAVALAA